jgi:hypothetical protein
MADRFSRRTKGAGDDTHSTSLIAKDQAQLTRVAQGREIVRSVFVVDLKPLSEPRVEKHFDQMGAIEAALSAITYQITVLEYRLGPNGWIRAWMLAALRILVFFIIPVIAFLIGLGFLVPAAAGVASLFHHVQDATQSIFWSVVFITATAAMVAALLGLLPVLRQIISKK